MPLITNKQQGFSPCVLAVSRQRTIFARLGVHDFSRAMKDDKQRGFSPCGTCGLQTAHDFRSIGGHDFVVPLRTVNRGTLKALRYLPLLMSRRSLRDVGTNFPVRGHDFSRAVKYG